jgi:spore coat polysaccharide biosynthesis protein SpsF (cytidylyltransferase family)
MYVHQHPDRFRTVTLPLPVAIDTELRFTIDYAEDVAFCEQVLALVAAPSLEEIAALLRRRPDLVARNLAFSRAHRKQYG